MTVSGPSPVGPWAPLTLPMFRAIWIATIVSNVGSAMQDVGATWLMISLDGRPTTVALLQAATAAPIMIFGLPAGVLADIVDRRRLLIAANLLMIVAAGGLAAATAFGVVTPGLLLGLTVLLGVGAALNAPAFQAVAAELAPADMLAPAIALNSLGFNIARTLGPALGGAAAAAGGPWLVFALNALSTAAVVATLAAWKREPQSATLPPEHFLSALRTSFRYVANAPAVRVVLLRTVLFFGMASGGWAMLPLIAHDRLGLSAAGYGLILGCLGAGAVAGAIALPRLKARFGMERVAQAGSAACALGAFCIAATSSLAIVLMTAPVFGAGWIASLTVLNASVQSAVSGWVRARILAVYVVTFSGSLALGSLLWGQLASRTSPSIALGAAAFGQVAALLIALALPFKNTGDLDLTPAAADAPPLLPDDAGEPGPILVTTDYQVPSTAREAFLAGLDRLGAARRRAGAMGWRRWSDALDPSIVRETYVVESWTEHLRQLARRTRTDAAVEADLLRFVAPGAPPQSRLFRGAGPNRSLQPRRS